MSDIAETRFCVNIDRETAGELANLAHRGFEIAYKHFDGDQTLKAMIDTAGALAGSLVHGLFDDMNHEKAIRVSIAALVLTTTLKCLGDATGTFTDFRNVKSEAMRLLYEKGHEVVESLRNGGKVDVRTSR